MSQKASSFLVKHLLRPKIGCHKISVTSLLSKDINQQQTQKDKGSQLEE